MPAHEMTQEEREQLMEKAMKNMKIILHALHGKKIFMRFTDVRSE